MVALKLGQVTRSWVGIVDPEEKKLNHAPKKGGKNVDNVDDVDKIHFEVAG